MQLKIHPQTETLGRPSSNRGFGIFLGAAVLLVSVSCGSSNPMSPQLIATETADRPYAEVGIWESAIADFERSDIANPPKSNSIVFIGSSSIVFWDSLESDMAPLPVIQRGFGGSRIYDAVYYADRVVWPYKPRAIVMFSGTNDLVVPNPDAARRVEQGFIDFVSDTRTTYPNVDIHYISMSFTASRWAARDDIRDANARIASIAANDDSLYYIDTASYLLKNGQPDASLFRDDQLHLNAKGYAVWSSIIRPHLMALYGD